MDAALRARPEPENLGRPSGFDQRCRDGGPRLSNGRTLKDRGIEIRVHEVRAVVAVRDPNDVAAFLRAYVDVAVALILNPIAVAANEGGHRRRC